MLTLISDYFQRILDWTCLQKLHLQKFVICLILLDSFVILVLVCSSLVLQFVYVNPAGRAGFVGKKWLNHTDIYSFRRQQYWELETPVDWDVDDRIYINDTRIIINELCSRYEFTARNDGDPGDYLKEVAGFPNVSGYNDTFRRIIRLLKAIVIIIYLTEPILVLTLWWKDLRARLIAGYVFIRMIASIITTVIAVEGNAHVLCAIDVIYNEHPISTYLILFSLGFWLYEILKSIILVLYCMEQSLARKRKDYGFRKRRAPARKEEATDDAKMEVKGKDSDTKKQNKKNRAKRAESDEDTISVKALAREILELGGTTDGDSAVESRAKEEKRRKEGNKPMATLGDGTKRKSKDKRGSKEVEGWNKMSKEAGDVSKKKSTKVTFNA